MSKLKPLLTAMLQKQASDLFLSPSTPIMLKVNGTCVAVNSLLLPDQMPLTLLSEVLSPEDLAVLHASGELNTSIHLDGIGHFRVSVMRQHKHFAAVVRAIPASIPSLQSLNLPGILAELIRLPRGLVLVVGATGSGKSTTVASMLEARNESQSGHILTIEDPIEYVFESKRSVVNQREVGRDTASFEVALKNGLRQAPDVIFIGEIRDASTMSQALAYAQTGHLVIATLHAGNAKQTLTRILNFYPPEVRDGVRADIAATLSAIVAQRLARSTQGQRFPAVELLINTAYISELITRNEFDRINAAIEESLTVGCQSFDQDFARLVHEGVVTQDVALAHADSPHNLMRRFERQAHGDLDF
jgi:twitching motility protein PilU